MDTTDIVTLIKESAFMLSTFGVVLMYAMIKGKYALINAIFALYIALLISIKFPYYAQIMGNSTQDGAIAKIILFIAITIASIVLFRRHIPGDDYETAFQGIGKKILLSLLATILIMAFSFHALPVTEIITPGTPIQSLFAPEQNFFWWLILPLVVLFFI